MLRLRAEEASCSFCGTDWSPDNPFVGGMGAMMCSRCLRRYAAVIDSPEALEKLAGQRWQREMTSDDMVEMLPKIVATERQVKLFLHDWVDLLRTRGRTWAEIGAALGVSRQAVWERFGHHKDR